MIDMRLFRTGAEFSSVWLSPDSLTCIFATAVSGSLGDARLPSLAAKLAAEEMRRSRQVDQQRLFDALVAGAALPGVGQWYGITGGMAEVSNDMLSVLTFGSRFNVLYKHRWFPSEPEDAHVRWLRGHLGMMVSPDAYTASVTLQAAIPIGDGPVFLTSAARFKEPAERDEIERAFSTVDSDERLMTVMKALTGHEQDCLLLRID